MANPNKWKIKNKSNSPHAGNELNNLLVKKTKSGYELYAVLGEVGHTNPPTFTNVHWDGHRWNIVFTNLLKDGVNGAGTWTRLDSASEVEPTGDTEGDFTAMASGGHPEDAEEAASSASA